jgi:hypothetical protein
MGIFMSRSSSFRMPKFFLGVLMLLLGFIHVNVSADPGFYEVRGEFLYFMPTSDQPFYAISSTNNLVGQNVFPNGRRHSNHSTFHPGLRLE